MVTKRRKKEKRGERVGIYIEAIRETRGKPVHQQLHPLAGSANPEHIATLGAKKKKYQAWKYNEKFPVRSAGR